MEQVEQEIEKIQDKSNSLETTDSEKQNKKARVIGTKINKIVMTGFKSFASRTELLFGDQFNVVLGPNGSGKCVVGDTKVCLSDGSSIKINELVESAIKKGVVEKKDDGLVAYCPNYQIFCMDLETQKIVSRPVLAFVKRTSPEKLLKIRTKTGREITATKYHPLFINVNGKVEPIRADMLKEGVRVAVPRILKTLKTQESGKVFTELLDMIMEKDQIYVPYNEEFLNILMAKKNKSSTSWKILASDIGVSYNAVKGILDGQSINFAHLVKILKFCNFQDSEIIKLIPRVKGKNTSLTVKFPWNNSPEFARFLGYSLAEGRLAPGQIWFTNGEENVVSDYAELINKVFEIRATVNEYKSCCWDVLIYSRPLIRILEKFGLGGGAGKKFVSSFFLKHSGEEEITNILSGLYSGDGYVSKNSVEITTKSKELAEGIETMLLRVGILFHTKDVMKIATNSGFCGNYKTIRIYSEGIRKFRQKIKLVHEMKQNRLESFKDTKINPNYDLIEANNLIREISKDLGINIKKTKKKFPRIDSYCYNQCTPSRFGVNKLIKELFLPSEINGKTSQHLEPLKLLADSDILWDEIESVQEIRSDQEWVYDLCVEKDHNFIANNFFVHNSNLLDALCFVLGKSSSKDLRAEKAANLIYNGGKTKQPMKFAEVSIYFDNKNKSFPIDNEEIKISRTVKGDGQSKYQINDKTKTKQEILDLLSAARIDPDGYNMIIQGDIVRFVKMSPNNRREIIEEIAGIGIYEERKEKALRELERVDERLKEAEIVLSERESYLKNLKSDRDQAIKYKEINDRILSSRASYANIQIKNREKQKERLDKLNVNEQGEINKISGEIKKIRDSINEKKEKIAEIAREIEQRGEESQLKLNKEIEALKTEVITAKARIDSLNSEIKRIIERKTSLKDSSDEIEKKIKECTEDNERLEKEKSSLLKDSKDIELKLRDFRKKHSLDHAGDIEKQIEDLDKVIEEKQKEVQALREEQQALFREKDRLEFKLQSIDNTILKVAEVEKENKKQIEDLQNKRTEFKRSAVELNKRLSDDSTIAAQLQNVRVKQQSFMEDLSRLKVKIATAREKAASNLAVKRILEQKKTIPGIHGTVGELGNADTKFALSLEAAAGNKIHHVVVDTDATAARCIKYLRDNKLGSATFLPINKMKAPAKIDLKSVLESKGVHGLALDLVTCDPKFKAIFAHVFGNTVVVDNIDTARRIGIGAAKMATLEGDLAELSGAMHGGYREKSQGSFQTKGIDEEISKAEAKIAELDGTISTLESKKHENENAITKLRESKASLEGEIIKIEKSLHLDSSDLDASNKEKLLVADQAKDLDARTGDMQTKISALNRNLADAKMKKQDLRNKISELRSPTLLAELTAFEQKRKEIEQKLINIEAEIKNNDAKVNTVFIPEKTRTLKVGEQIAKEQGSFEKEITELKVKILDKEKDLKDKEKRAREFYEKFKASFTERGKLQEFIQKDEEKIYKKEEEIRKIDRKINESSVQVAEIRTVLASLYEEFKKYGNVKLQENKTEEELKKQISEFENLINRMGSVNMRALEIYESVEREYNSLMEKKEKLKKEKDDVIFMMNEIESKKKDIFMETFDLINHNFSSIFSNLSSKGKAYLEIENPEDPFAEGVNIKVRLSGTRYLDVKSLSGGEQTMTSLAFIFAIQENDPASFYVLDEIDAALDKKNAEKLAYLIKKYSNRAQYVVISHNDALISQADILYGVSMDEHGMSKVVSMRA